MEPEYTAFSMSLCTVIPLMAVTEAINKGLKFIHHQRFTLKATVHEDNMSGLWLSQLEPGHNTPGSKFYALKLHWFHTWLKPKYIKVVHCPTQQQKADVLTKALGPTAFRACRLLSIVW